MEKQKALTVITGFSLKDKCDVIRKLQRKNANNIRVIRFRPTDVKLVVHSAEDPFPLTHFVSEAVHHLEINTVSNLLTILEEECDNEHIDEIILDIYPISTFESLLGSFASQMKRLNYSPKAHIHILNARDFWFAYFSEHSIQTNELNSTPTLEYTLGEAFIHQLEHAGMIYLTNTEQLSHERLAELTVFIQNLQPNAVVERLHERVWRTENNNVGFDLEAANYLYSHQIELFSSRRNLNVIGQYGIETFVYQSNSPIDFSRLEDFFSNLPNEVFRMKGRCYHSSKQELYSISQVGSSIQVDTTLLPINSNHFLTEFLFIGSEMNHQEIERMLDNCLQITYAGKIAY
ncbi:GTP-binding protein [Halalkalibacter krulwichiae]|uniref:Putative metal chaperone YciC n=1 Tax=Halalkalibacter krulwichiae TaxID=199441 RepID=A0A1X9MEP8_9BACI|nr:GTP-binding protein [Halalkalibacter krulwichiae]ARK30011.1 Putative metal chaperone YciC [Halalkalibacter krulwichiae]